MPAHKVICPHCSRPLKTRKPPVEGHLILCPRCGRSFRVPTTASPAHAARPSAQHETTSALAERETASSPALVTETAPATPVPPALAASDLDADSEPVSPGQSERGRLLAILILGGLAVTMLVTFLLVLYFAARRPTTAHSGQSLSAASSGEEPLTEPIPDGNDASSGRSAEEAPVEKPWLSEKGQKEVDAAIARGVAFLKTGQDPFGSWGPQDGHHVGLAALPALTLLECGVPADDACIQKAVEHVRKNVPQLNLTYDLALSILLLDKLGLEEDRPRIRTLALRLVSGQLPSGGWTYGCPLLSGKDENDLENTLTLIRPRSSMELLAMLPSSSESGGAEKPGAMKPLEDPSAAPDSSPDFEGKRLTAREIRKAREALPEPLRQLPVLQPTRRGQLPFDGSDNSNTQFAILGLWAAGRQDLPLERSLALIVQRFRTSQTPEGGWGYHSQERATQSMTCAGLLGLAVGHGLRVSSQPRAEPQRLKKDPAIEKGFRYVAHLIGKPHPWGGAQDPLPGGLNLYLMWSLERVGVLYNRRTIDNRDWYGWGAQAIVETQQKNGCWHNGVYPGSMPITDTSFALLFLKRANLAKDLTKKLEFVFEGKKIR